MFSRPLSFSPSIYDEDLFWPYRAQQSLLSPVNHLGLMSSLGGFSESLTHNTPLKVLSATTYDFSGPTTQTATPVASQEEEKSVTKPQAPQVEKNPTGRPVQGWLPFPAKLYLSAKEGRTFFRWLKKEIKDPHSRLWRDLRLKLTD